MPSPDSLYTAELAWTTLDMITGGMVLDPSCQEIAYAHFPNAKALGYEVIEGVRERLGKIALLLEQEYEQPVYLVTKAYYTRYQRTVPATILDRRRCLAASGGQGAKKYGIRVQTANDPLWHEYVGQNLATASGKYRRNGDRVVDSITSGRVSEEEGGGLLVAARDAALPAQPKVAEQAILAIDP